MNKIIFYQLIRLTYVRVKETTFFWRPYMLAWFFLFSFSLFGWKCRMIVDFCFPSRFYMEMLYLMYYRFALFDDTQVGPCCYIIGVGIILNSHMIRDAPYWVVTSLYAILRPTWNLNMLFFLYPFSIFQILDTALWVSCLEWKNSFSFLLTEFSFLKEMKSCMIF